jgi:hypothetical protein
LSPAADLQKLRRLFLGDGFSFLFVAAPDYGSAAPAVDTAFHFLGDSSKIYISGGLFPKGIKSFSMNFKKNEYLHVHGSLHRHP